jgi:hypothetical protein
MVSNSGSTRSIILMMACGIDMDDWGCSDVNENVTARGFSSMILCVLYDMTGWMSAFFSTLLVLIVDTELH